MRSEDSFPRFVYLFSLLQLHDFFGKYPNAGAAASARKQALDQVAMNIEWIKSRGENLRQALSTIL